MELPLVRPSSRPQSSSREAASRPGPRCGGLCRMDRKNASMPTPLFAEALFTVGAGQKPPRPPRRDDWMGNMWGVHTTKYSSALTGLLCHRLPHAGTDLSTRNDLSQPNAPGQLLPEATQEAPRAATSAETENSGDCQGPGEDRMGHSCGDRCTTGGCSSRHQTVRLKWLKWGLGGSSAVEPLPGRCKALGSAPAAQNGTTKKVQQLNWQISCYVYSSERVWKLLGIVSW